MNFSALVPQTSQPGETVLVAFRNVGCFLSLISEPTTEPCTVKWCWILADNEAVTIAVNIAIMMIPTRIHKIQKIRAKNDLGARSPYLQPRKHYGDFRLNIAAKINEKCVISGAFQSSISCSTFMNRNFKTFRLKTVFICLNSRSKWVF